MLSRITSKDDITQEALSFLQLRLENRAYSITHKDFPVVYSLNKVAVDNKQIYISKPKALTIDEIKKAHAFLIHESAHIRFGSLEFQKINTIILRADMKYEYAHSTLNIIEDYRVNELIQITHPGAGRLMFKIHQELIDKMKFKTAFASLLPVLNGHKVNMKLSKSEKEKLNKAVEIIKPVKYATDIDASLKILKQVYDIFFPKIDVMKKNYTDKREKQQKQVDEKEESGLPERELNVKTSTNKKEVEKNIKQAVKKLTKSEKENKESLMKAESEAEAELEKINAELEKIQNKADKKQTNEIDKLLKASRDTNFKSSAPIRTVKETEYNKVKYNKIKNENRNAINHLTKQLKKNFLFERQYRNNQRYGKINNKKLYTVLSNDETRVFKRRTDKDVGDIAVLLLVDCSGSMGESISSKEKKYESARKCAVILHEVLRNLKIKHMIAGYTADYDYSNVDTVSIVYKTWNDKDVSYNLSKIKDYWNNRDGDSIRLAVKYFEQIREKKKLIIVISDGHPRARYDYKDEKGIEDTVLAQKETVSKKIKLINIGIGMGWELPKNYINKIKVDDISKLPNILVRVLKRELSK